MAIKESKDGSTYTFVLQGRLDTTTAPLIEERFSHISDDIKEVIFDFSDLDYISSAGLRTLLVLSEIIGEDNTLTIKGANEMILDLFYTTGFSEMLNLIQ